MKKFTCELCGGHELKKNQEGFTCTGCGCNYSSDDVKKMMVEIKEEEPGQNNMSGIQENTLNLSNDERRRLEKIKKNADTTFHDGNFKEAFDLYSAAMNIDPDHPHMIFYRVISSAMQSTIKEPRIGEVDRATKRAVELMYSQFGVKKEFFDFVEDAYTQLAKCLNLISNQYIEYFNSIQKARGITITGNLATMGIAYETKGVMQNGIENCCTICVNATVNVMNLVSDYAQSGNDFWEIMYTLLNNAKIYYSNAKMKKGDEIDKLIENLYEEKRNAIQGRIEFAKLNHPEYWSLHKTEKDALLEELKELQDSLSEIQNTKEPTVQENNAMIEKLENDKKETLDVDKEVESVRQEIANLTEEMKKIPTSSIKEKAYYLKQIAVKEVELAKVSDASRKKHKEKNSKIDSQIAELKNKEKELGKREKELVDLIICKGDEIVKSDGC